jgi:uroporphyrinogen decarboxylase
MKPRERVLRAINHVQPDRVPVDFQSVEDSMPKLRRYFNTKDDDKILESLQIDCRWVIPSYHGPAPKHYPDGTFDGFGGSRLRLVNNQFGAYEEVVKYAVDEAEKPEDIEKLLKLPALDDYDFASVTDLCRKYDDYAIFAGMCSAFYYPTLVRSMEKIFLDMVINPDLAHTLFSVLVDWHLEYHERLLDAGKDRIDVLQIADDFSTQRGLLFSIDMFRTYFKDHLKKFVALGKSYNTKIFFHCCGSAYEIIPELIDVGVEILDPIQTTAANMEPKRLKNEFGNKLAFHGAADTQGTLPRGTPEDVKREVRELIDILGNDGGFSY